MARTAQALGTQRRPAPLRHRRPNGWLLLLIGFAVVTLMPVAVVVGSFAQLEVELWQHLARYVLPHVAFNTLWMALGVVVCTLVLGTALAWLTAVCDFPGRRFFTWALLLPMAMPGYVLATAMSGMLEFGGPMHSLLRALFGSEVSMPGFRHLGGVIFALSLVLYPYVYLLARNAFLSQGSRGLEVAKSLGLGPWRGFFRVSLPLARPWLAAGATLVLMEALADFGTVAVFNYETFTLAIYRAWYGMFSVHAALQLSGVLILAVLLVVSLEHRLRGRSGYAEAFAGMPQTRLIRLSPARRWAAFGCAGGVFALAFAIPATQLAVWALPGLAEELDRRYWQWAFNSLLLAVSGALLVTGLGLLLGYAARSARLRSANVLARLATLGYAFPGTVLAVGVFVPVAAASNALSATLGAVFGPAAPQIALQGTLATLMLAYCIRFLAVAHGPVSSQLERITRNIDDAARGLGVGGSRLLATVHLPILRRGLVIALVLAFVDIMKELPITLMTRPFGWDTLATRVFQMTTEGDYQRAALPALAIVVVGLVPVVLLLHQSDRRRA